MPTTTRPSSTFTDNPGHLALTQQPAIEPGDAIDRLIHVDALPAITDVPAPVYGEPPSEAEVAAEAYALFEARGFEHGHDVEDWVAAEAIVRQRRALPEGQR
jgi:hypothetical protein